MLLIYSAEGLADLRKLSGLSCPLSVLWSTSLTCQTARFFSSLQKRVVWDQAFSLRAPKGVTTENPDMMQAAWCLFGYRELLATLFRFLSIVGVTNHLLKEFLS